MPYGWIAKIKELQNAFFKEKKQNKTEEQSKEDIFATMDAFEDSLIVFAKENLNDTNPKVAYDCDQLGEWKLFFSCHQGRSF